MDREDKSIQGIQSQWAYSCGAEESTQETRYNTAPSIVEGTVKHKIKY